MNTGIIIQARQSSSRLPNKIMLPLGSGHSVLGHVIERAKRACPLVIVATTTEKEDDITEKEAIKYGTSVYRGSLDDVLSRYVGAMKEFHLEKAVRITSDCPCIDPSIIKNILNLLETNDVDYVSNIDERTFPHGMDTEAFTADALFRSSAEENRPEYREHVTLHIRQSNIYRKLNYTTNTNVNPNIRVTLDTDEDYTALLAVYDLLGDNFSWRDVVHLYEKHTWLSRINSNVYQKSVFLNEDEERLEAIKLLKLHKMDNIVEKIK